MGENSYGTVMVVVVRCPTHLLLALRKRTDYLPVVTCCCWVSCFVTSGQSVRMDRNNKTDTGYADPRLLLPGSVTSLDHAIHQQCLTNTCGIAKKWKSNVFIISVLDLVGGCPLLYIFICEACDLGKKKTILKNGHCSSFLSTGHGRLPCLESPGDRSDVVATMPSNHHLVPFWAVWSPLFVVRMEGGNASRLSGSESPQGCPEHLAGL